MLCMALALVYAGALGSQVAGQLQHAPTQVADHDHLMFSDVLTLQADDHADASHDGKTTDDQSQDQLAGGHHHHGDTGPSLMTGTADELAGVILFETVRPSIKDRQIAGVAVPGPERPPRQMILAA